jgi:hypothetical protein
MAPPSWGNPTTLQAYRGLLARLRDIQHLRAIEVEAILANSKGD